MAVLWVREMQVISMTDAEEQLRCLHEFEPVKWQSKSCVRCGLTRVVISAELTGVATAKRVSRVVRDLTLGLTVNAERLTGNELTGLVVGQNAKWLVGGGAEVAFTWQTKQEENAERVVRKAFEEWMSGLGWPEAQP